MTIEPEEILKECKVTYFLSSGPGGQHRDRKRTAVRLEHLPTGIVAVSRRRRSREMNRREALERLVERIEERRRVRRPRIPTRVPRKARERILEAKRRRSRKKKWRGRISTDEEG